MIVDVARITSITTPSGAATASAGVKATWTRTAESYRRSGATLRGHVHAHALLPPPEPGDLRLLLRVRPPDLYGVHDRGPGRPALPGPLGQAAGRSARHGGGPALG